MSRWVIANPPDKNVTATTNPAHSSTFFRGRELIVDVKEVRDGEGTVANTRGACSPGISAALPREIMSEPVLNLAFSPRCFEVLLASGRIALISTTFPVHKLK